MHNLRLAMEEVSLTVEEEIMVNKVMEVAKVRAMVVTSPTLVHTGDDYGSLIKTLNVIVQSKKLFFKLNWFNYQDFYFSCSFLDLNRPWYCTMSILF